MTKKRINSLYSENKSKYNSVHVKNDLYTIYKKQFDKFFNIDTEINAFTELEEIYVPNISFEREINEFRNSLTDSTTICIGSRGAGKTTSILYSFNFDPNKDVVKIDDLKKELVFYVRTDDLDIDSQNPNNQLITEQISFVCTYLLKHFPATRDKLCRLEGKKEFYDSLRHHAPFVFTSTYPLNFAQLSEDMNLERIIKSGLSFVKSNYPYIYETYLLRFILNNNLDKIHNFIIILDNIELQDNDVQLNLILSFLRFHESMCHLGLQDGINTKTHFTKLLISLRRDSYHNFVSNNLFETFPINRYAFISIAELNLSDLFEKRFIYYTKAYVDSYKYSQNSVEQYRILREMSKKLNDQYSVLIKKICCYNIRKSLVLFADILTNRYYVQNNSRQKHYIELSTEKFTFSNHSVIRAIACRENCVFWGDDISDGFIPNILFTSLHDDYSIECLLIMKYYSIHLEPYSIGAESFEYTRANWLYIFGERITNRLFVALKYLIKNKVIRQVSWDRALINMYDDVTIDENDFLYLSPMGEQIFELLHRDSEALELFREAAWRDYNHKKYSVLPSCELLPNMQKNQSSKQDVLFTDLLEYISDLVDSELGFIKTIQKNNTMNKYLSFFGFETVSFTLFSGVKSTINCLGINQEYPEVKNTYNQTENKVIALMAFLNNNTPLE